MNTTKFFKKLTAAEVGNKGTHEVYIRMPNDFDYENFFDNTHIENGSVIEVNFDVTIESSIDKTLPLKTSNLRFVYFANSNKEKRIPSLGSLFKEFNVQEGDVISLEKIEEGNIIKYYLRFLPQEIVQIYNGGILLKNDNNIPREFPKNIYSEKKEPLQIIFYGAPGTGKSYTIDSMTTEDNSVRTTFHPDSDYASFIGAYKPTMEEVPISAIVGKDVHEAVPQGKHSGKEKKIVYKYVPQAFLKAYVEAWKRYAGEKDETEILDLPDLPLYSDNNSAKDNKEIKTNGISPYYLIIEEINRGNCAQIFGDLFQLLDRNNTGTSSYPIYADEDIARFLREDENGFAGITESQRDAIADFRLIKDNGEEREIGEDILNGKLLLLPPNLHVWATMNTSDQSLFPIDSAFKRRWDWEYTPISYNPKDKKTGEEIKWKFEAGGNLYSWGEFLSKINPEIESLTESADKQMGYFFAKANPTTGVISEKVFVNKVIFYLWTEVLKDFDMGKDPFINPETKKTFKFTDFFDSNQNAVVNFISNLKLSPLDDNQEELSIMGLEDNEISNTGINDERSSNLKEWRQRFWETVQERYRKSGFDFSVSPTTRNYYQITTGVVDLNFINSVNKRDGSCWVGLYFEAKSAKELYPEILTHKEEIENSMPFQLDWIANNEKHGYACIRVSKSGIDFENIQQSEDTASWLAEHGIKIFNAFKPYFNRLK